VSDLDFVQAGDLHRNVMNEAKSALTENIPCVHSMDGQQIWGRLDKGSGRFAGSRSREAGRVEIGYRYG
jgi:hypothetical protein